MIFKNFCNKILFISVFFYFLIELLQHSCCLQGSRSYGGEILNISKAPYIVLLMIGWKTVGKCTGSIISEEWVLTAAHCFITSDLNKIEVIAGIDNMDVTVDMQKRKPTRLVIHPHYLEYKILKWDLALLQVPKFNLSSDKVDVLQLGGDEWPQNDFTYKRRCLAVGWGLPDQNTKNNTKLHSTEVYAEHGSKACKCLHSYEKKRAVCLVREEGKGICGGDSGGPLVCDGKNYGVAHIIYDIAKCTLMDMPEKITCGRYSTVGVYTFTCPELNWIKDYVSSVPGRPKSCKAPVHFIRALMKMWPQKQL